MFATIGDRAACASIQGTCACMMLCVAGYCSCYACLQQGCCNAEGLTGYMAQQHGRLHHGLGLTLHLPPLHAMFLLLLKLIDNAHAHWLQAPHKMKPRELHGGRCCSHHGWGAS